MDIDSDSDDDLLPNMNSLNNMFASVSQQVRREAPPPKPKDPRGDSKGSSSKDDGSNSKQKKRKHLFSKSSAKRVALDKDPDNCNGLSNGKEEEVPPDELSDDTSKLLAQAESLGVPSRAAALQASASASTSKSAVKIDSDAKTQAISVDDDDEIEEVEVTEPASTTRSGRKLRSTTRSARNKKKGAAKKEPAKEAPLVSLGDISTDEDPEVSTQEINMDELDLKNCSQISDTIEVEPIVQEWSLRIRWKEEIMRFSIPVGSKISQLRMNVGLRLEIRADDLVVFNEKESADTVPDDTLVEQIPYGSTLSVFRRLAESTDAKKLGPNYIQLKVQGSASYRERLTVAIQKTTHIKQLLDDYVEKFGLTGKKFKLIFDGDDVDLTETAQSLDLDGGEMFDIVEVA